MPKLWKGCAETGCGVRVLAGQNRCAPHAKERRQASDRARGTSTQRGYGYRWQRYRAQFLIKWPLCGDRIAGPSADHSRCVAQGRSEAATIVDHITPHLGNYVLMWDPGNHQGLCKGCHDRKTAKEDGGGWGRMKG